MNQQLEEVREVKRRPPGKMQTLFFNVCGFCCMAVVVAVTLKMIINIFF